jgi:Nucleotide-diphospho-sugar transferase
MGNAKIRIAQLVSVLGYDFLCQDVDVVWFRSPLEYFNNSTDKAFDIYFQQDGIIRKINTPNGINAGFYYAKNNERTKYFFTSMLLSGDTLFLSYNDQIEIGVRLADHSSTYGLKVKVIPRTEPIAPGGYQFHDTTNSGKEYMKKFLNGSSNPYIFHMSWTDGMTDKLFYLRQMGQWYVKDQCIGKSFDEILDGSPRHEAKKTIPLSCCSSEPILSCHYRDKPSLIPCTDRPPKDNNAPSWW